MPPRPANDFVRHYRIERLSRLFASAVDRFTRVMTERTVIPGRVTSCRVVLLPSLPRCASRTSGMDRCRVAPTAIAECRSAFSIGRGRCGASEPPFLPGGDGHHRHSWSSTSPVVPLPSSPGCPCSSLYGPTRVARLAHRAAPCISSTKVACEEQSPECKPKTANATYLPAHTASAGRPRPHAERGSASMCRSALIQPGLRSCRTANREMRRRRHFGRSRQ